MADLIDASLKELNKLFPSKEALYDLLFAKKGYYLPNLHSKAVTI